MDFTIAVPDLVNPVLLVNEAPIKAVGESGVLEDPNLLCNALGFSVTSVL